MMKTLRVLHGLVGLVCLLLAGGCTHNNGDIGPYFGTWHLTEMKCGTEPVAGYDGNIFWSFQSNIIKLTRTLDPKEHDAESAWGTWEEEKRDGATVLKLDFGHSDDLAPEPGTGMYRPFEILNFAPSGITTLRVQEIKGNKMALLTTDIFGGSAITYYLTKI